MSASQHSATRSSAVPGPGVASATKSHVSADDITSISKVNTAQSSASSEMETSESISKSKTAMSAESDTGRMYHLRKLLRKVTFSRAKTDSDKVRTSVYERVKALRENLKKPKVKYSPSHVTSRQGTGESSINTDVLHTDGGHRLTFQWANALDNFAGFGQRSHPWRDKIIETLNSTYFEAILSLTTIINIIAIAWDAECRADPNTEPPHWVALVDRICLAIYCLELVVRLMVLHINRWQGLDGIIVVVGIVGEIVESQLQAALVLRLFKAFRIIRMIRILRQLQVMRMIIALLHDMQGTVKLVVGGFFLELLIILIFALFGMELLHSSITDKVEQGIISPDSSCVLAFSSIYRSILSLIGIMTLDQWHEIAFPIAEAMPLSLVFFLFYLVTTVYGVALIIQGAVILHPMEYVKTQGALAEAMRDEKKANAKVRLKEIFDAMDISRSGKLTFQELFHMRNASPEFAHIIRQMDMHDSDLDIIWDILDLDKDGLVDQQEFLDVMWRLQSDQTKWTLMQLENTTEKLQQKLTRVEEKISEIPDAHSIAIAFLKLLNVREDRSDFEEIATDDGSPDAWIGDTSEQVRVSTVRMYTSSPSAHAKLTKSSSVTWDEEPTASTLAPLGGASASGSRGSQRGSHSVAFPKSILTRSSSMRSDGPTRSQGPVGKFRSDTSAKSDRSIKLNVSVNSELLEEVNQTAEERNGGLDDRDLRKYSYVDKLNSESADKVKRRNTQSFAADMADGGDAAEEMALRYMRGVTAGPLAHFGRAETLDFWRIDRLRPLKDSQPQPCERCDYFISHCWLRPNNWIQIFPNTNAEIESYEYKKSLQLHSTLQLAQRQLLNAEYNAPHRKNSEPKGDVPFGYDPMGRQRPHRWEDFMCWVDKACIPQSDADAKQKCIILIEEFLKLSDGLIVLLCWHYFSRLWCIYEWACFLVLHHPLRVEIGLDAFLKYNPDETLPLFLESVESISVKGAECYKESDRLVLEEKVFKYYCGHTPEESFASFERFAKVTALALIAKEIILWRSRTDEDSERGWLQPLRDLAKRLDFDHLHKALVAARPAKWYQECQSGNEDYEAVVNSWMTAAVLPCLLSERRTAVRRHVRKGDAECETTKAPRQDVIPEILAAKTPTGNTVGAQRTSGPPQSSNSFGQFSNAESQKSTQPSTVASIKGKIFNAFGRRT